MILEAVPAPRSTRPNGIRTLEACRLRTANSGRISAMRTQWCYGQLVVLSAGNYNSALLDEQIVTAALISDAQGIRVVETWRSYLYSEYSPQLLYAAMDKLGDEGWIVGPRSWTSFQDNGMPIAVESRPFPEWIRTAVRGIEGFEPQCYGYASYPLRRPRD